MKTDIQIAQEATLQPIKEVAATIGIEEEDLELYGKYKAKISDDDLLASSSSSNTSASGRPVTCRYLKDLAKKPVKYAALVSVFMIFPFFLPAG